MFGGVVGFFYSSSFGSPGHTDLEFDIFAINGWHNLVHVLSGAIGLVVWQSYGAARVYAIAFGFVYAIVAIWGLTIGDGESILGIVPINTADNILHLLIALAGIAAGLATHATPRPSEASAQPGPRFPLG